ncbi:DgyrCDS2633 [Dimorphilus gyrociliatus]|uniref:Transporter n=1 Tax=Dimorphilus gyrociliatus TaxID=2664684 RepID=A0A7I8VG14_9ANNE|nr:DgyrCDS2633 [Dimorphilus gyrociliatus]
MAKNSNHHDVEKQAESIKEPAEQTNVPLPTQKDGNSLKSDDTSVLPERDQWANKLDFVVSCIGFAVGLGNIWRFPYLCYKNGGGAFLIPYFICLICGGVPILFLEISLGQFMRQGGYGVWKICPIFQGIGCATTVIAFLMNSYYIIIIAWAVHYCFSSFTSELPWSHCNNSWNTPNCSTFESGANYTNDSNRVDSVVQFWEKKILNISDGIDNPGGIVWQNAVCLLFVWIVCYFCVWKGVKWTGKVVYFTALFPYLVLTILLIRGVTLDGAIDGITFYLKPDFKKLGDSQVWIDAGTQIFFSYAIALGAMTALGSYNKFHNNCYKDCIIVSLANSSTSLYAGFAIFSVLGFMAKQQGIPVDEVAEKGPGLVFIVYPKAVTQMPVPTLWAILFFVMIFLLGLDSQFVGMESFITVIVDLFPVLRKKWYKETFVAGYVVLSFLIGLSMVTQGGMYVFQLFDYYSASGMTLLWVCFFEAIAIGWVYGGKKYYDNLELMLGFRIDPWFRICWSVMTPVVTFAIFISVWVTFEPLTYNRTYEYPGWAQAIGMCMGFISMICIPLYVPIALFNAKGKTLKQRIRDATTAKLQDFQLSKGSDDYGKFKTSKHMLEPSLDSLLPLKKDIES